MDDPLWDPDRLRTVGIILGRYSRHVRPGHVVRLGLDGDTCTPFRSTESAPKATVLDVERRDDGYVSLRAQLHDSKAIIDLNNRDVSAERVWEIDPEEDNLERFRQAVHEDMGVADEEEANAAEEEKDTLAAEEAARKEEEEHRFRSTLHSKMETMEQKLADLDTAHSELKRMFGLAFREFAGDVVRCSNGEKPEFCGPFRDRYDIAMEDAPEEGETFGKDTLHTREGASKKQHEKYDFELRDVITKLGEEDSLSEV